MKKIPLIVGILLIGLSISCLDSSLPEPVPFEELLARDLEIIDAYLEENNVEVEIHESGIRYVTTEEGTGDSPLGSDLVRVIYVAKLLDDTQVDESPENESSVFRLNELILAWQIMIPEMKEGGKMTLYAPSVYCYGNVQRALIPPNSNLIFDIELVEIVNN